MSGLMILLVLAGGSLVALPVALRIMRRPEIGIYLFLFLSSITMTPGFPLVGDRLAFADFVMAFTILAAWIGGRRHHVEPQVRHVELYADVLITFCTVSSLLGIAFGVDPGRAALFMVIYVYGYLVFKTIVRRIDSPEKFRSACVAWGLGAALVIVVGFMAATGIYRPPWAFDPEIHRISSTMRGSGQVSSYIAPALLVYVFAAGNRRLRPWYRFVATVLCAMALVVLLGTGSRISFVMLLFFLAYVAFLTLRRRRHFSRVPLALLVTGMVILGGSFAVSVWQDTSEEYSLLKTSPFERPIKMFSEQARRTQKGGEGVLEEFGGTRYGEVNVALRHFLDRPIFGVGSGLFSETFQMSEVHNSAFSLLIENGVFAFLLYWFWWGSIALLLLRSRRMARTPELRFVYTLAIGMVMVFLLYQMTTNGLRQRPFWFVPALALCSYRLLRLEEQPRSDVLESFGVAQASFPAWSPPESGQM